MVTRPDPSVSLRRSEEASRIRGMKKMTRWESDAQNLLFTGTNDPGTPSGTPGDLSARRPVRLLQRMWSADG